MTKLGASRWIGFLSGILVSAAALTAQQPFSRIPSSAIAFYDKTTATGCPLGWSEVTGARGYYLTGLVSGGTRGSAVGTALTNLENRTHTHDISHTHDITHTHTYSGATDGGAAASTKDFGGNAGAVTGHTHTGSGTTSGASTVTSGGASTSTSGTASTTIVPYLHYLVCKKA